jgi:DNA repair exonuclease SbcCD ATPase subunit
MVSAVSHEESDEANDFAVTNQLVATLKTELAEQHSIAKQLQESEAQVQDLQVTVRDLERALTEARTEAKTLKAKLSASRSGDMTGAKTSSTVGGDAPVASSQVAQMKEDLYGDLTGLIIRGIKKEGNDDIFDCIQTGRNGSKLSAFSNLNRN